MRTCVSVTDKRIAIGLLTAQLCIGNILVYIDCKVRKCDSFNRLWYVSLVINFKAKLKYWKIYQTVNIVPDTVTTKNILIIMLINYNTKFSLNLTSVFRYLWPVREDFVK